MKRRSFLAVGAGTAVVLAVAGGLVATVQPGMAAGRLSAPGQAVLRAVTLAVLGDLLPPQADARARALDAQAARLDATVAAFAPHVQRELSDVLALLSTAPGRWALAGLATGWSQATPAQVQAALAGLRGSTLTVRLQIYHALRDLTCAAFFADPRHGAVIGYPGPRPLG